MVSTPWPVHDNHPILLVWPHLAQFTQSHLLVPEAIHQSLLSRTASYTLWSTLLFRRQRFKVVPFTSFLQMGNVNPRQWRQWTNLSALFLQNSCEALRSQIRKRRAWPFPLNLFYQTIPSFTIPILPFPYLSSPDLVLSSPFLLSTLFPLP